MSDTNPAPTQRRGVLDWIEYLGNKLPEPALLFALLAALTVVLSAIGSNAGWSVQPLKLEVVKEAVVDANGAPVLEADGTPATRPALKEDGKPQTSLVPVGEPLGVRNLLTRDGIYWMLSSMVRNFILFPPLGLVLVSMLGIGMAEKVGLFGTLMRGLAFITPKKLLTPVIVFIGANSSIASDAGYIILPPLAAALFMASGRHPLAGLAAAFAGVAGGFGAGAFITAADTVLAGVATQAAHVLDTSHTVLPTANWFFKAVSVLVVAAAGWIVTDFIVEKRLLRANRPIPAEAMTIKPGDFGLSRVELKGLALALLAMGAVLAIFIGAMLIKGAPLQGEGQPLLPNGAPAPGERSGPRWSQIIVPMMFFAFLTPGIVYGLVTGSIKSQQDVVAGFVHAVRGIAPVVVMNFFAAQFLAYFQYTNMDKMLAYAGGEMLVGADLPVPVLLVLFVVFIIVADFAMSSMTAKFTLLAPILIPMFMMVGISPALTMAGYRIGDSVVNIVSPLNSYLAIVLLVLQRYQKDGGLGSLIALMVPYSIMTGILWTGFLLLWYFTGMSLGPGGPLHYVPPG